MGRTWKCDVEADILMIILKSIDDGMKNTCEMKDVCLAWPV